jgi:8-amino-7-oxononanoate synthase
MNDQFLLHKLNERKAADAFRELRLTDGLVDLCSNDYLGIARNGLLEQALEGKHYKHGSTGSRLLSGNHKLAEEAEAYIAAFHAAPAALIFNSGYDANTGLLSCVPQRHDTILYDELCHASIRDGIRLSFAQSFSFLHNDVDDLRKKMQHAAGQVFVVTESVFSMDGDVAPLKEMVDICEHYGCHLIVDEAHATGVIGERGAGLVQHLQLQDRCFARVHTFGKAPGCHGAAVVGSTLLRDYLINFSRPFVFTTALPEISMAAILHSYKIFPEMQAERMQLSKLISAFKEASAHFPSGHVLKSDTPIQGIIIPGNEAVKRVAKAIQAAGMDVRPILYPTVPKGRERLRIVVHSFNEKEHIMGLAEIAGRLISQL